jgi:hypothetical protein
VILQHRKAEGGRATSPRKPAIPEKRLRFPFYLRLVRRGNSITPYTSVDGTVFKRAGQPQTFSPSLPESLYAGYAVTAEQVRVSVMSRFSDFKVEPLGTE